MSSGQKQAAEQGQFPELYTYHAQSISDKNKLKDYRFWTREFWVNRANALLLTFNDAFQKEHSSPAVSMVEDLPFYLHRKEGETNLRWKLQVPSARKMLCIIDDNETLVNFCHALERNTSNVYHNGNMIDRDDICGFFGLPNADRDILENNRREKRKDYQGNLSSEEKRVLGKFTEKPLKDQLKANILHNMIEYVLSDITGLDEIEHNRLRKDNFDAFLELVKTKYTQKDAAYFTDKLKTSIDDAGAQRIGALLADLSCQMQSSNPAQFKRFVDNWSLDTKLFEHVKCNHNFNRHFECFAQQHLVISVMAGMSDSETPVEESKPFLGFSEDNYNLHDNEHKAKKRQRTSLEILNDTSRESAFTPKYLNISEKQCDNYFRLGFVGAYVSNKKTEGFSDRNLHTVVNLAETTLSATNSPEKLIQGIGRNRGLDDTAVPAYIHAMGRNQETTFDLNHLKKDDYYPELFKAQDVYNKQSVKVLGDEVGREIIAWYYKNLDADEQVDANRLKRQTLKIIARALRKLNNQNQHDIKLSRSQLTTVTAHAMRALDKEVKRIKKPYRLSLFVSILSNVLNFICSTYYLFHSIPAARKLSEYQKDESIEKSDVDKTYIKIIQNTDYKNLIKEVMIAKEFKSWLFKKVNAFQKTVKNNPLEYVNILSQSIHQEKLTPLATEKLTPVLFHPQFLTTLKNSIGFLNQADIALVLEAKGISEHKKAATDIIEFLAMLENQDKAAFSKWVTLPANKMPGFNELPLKKTLDNIIADLLEEVVDCNCYYNNHDTKGEYYPVAKPALNNKISEGLSRIQVGAPRTFLSGFSRKLFFIRGTCNGLPIAGQVNADSNALKAET
ncbi:MAG: hypothetical protein QNK11_09330 [Legionella sp.]|nr:hypothetical protein [Legionella sp.]